MKRFSIIYQSTPYNYTSPSTLVIEAETKVDAFVTAYDHLSQRGETVDTHELKYGSYSDDYNTTNRASMITKDEAKEIMAAGVPALSGNVRIRHIEEYVVKPKGKVVLGIS